MNVQDCLQTLRAIRDVSFATVDQEGHPQIRIIDVMLVQEGALYFCTSRGKDFHAQLMRDPHAAIVGMTHDFKMVRLAGKYVSSPTIPAPGSTASLTRTRR